MHEANCQGVLLAGYGQEAGGRGLRKPEGWGCHRGAGEVGG